MGSGVTIYSVAERAGVSISTVSRVLRGSVPVAEETKRRVEDAVAELRYVPSGAATHLATKRQPSLGLVLPHLEGEYYAAVLFGFELMAAELGYTTTASSPTRARTRTPFLAGSPSMTSPSTRQPARRPALRVSPARSARPGR